MTQQSKEALIDHYYGTSDPAKRKGLATRISALENKTPVWDAVKSAGGYALDQLERPLNVLRGAYNSGTEGLVKGAFDVPQTWGDDLEGATNMPYVLGNPMIDPLLGTDVGYPSAGVAPIPNKVLEGAADIVFNPIDIATGGLFAGSKRLAKVAGITKKAGKGRHTAAFSNYVDNYYGLAKDFPDMSEADRNMIENLVMGVKGDLPKELRDIPGIGPILEKYHPKAKEFAAKVEKLTDRERQTALEKGRGLVGTLKAGVKRIARDYFNPHEVAKWKQWGVNSSTQEIMKKHLADMDAGVGGGRWEAKAVAQGQYLNHTLRQSGREGNIHPAVQAIADISNLEDYSLNEADTVLGWLQDYKAVEVAADGTETAVQLSKADAAFAYEHMNSTTGSPDLMVMKRPEQAATGKHKFDVLGVKNSGWNNTVSAFTDLIGQGVEITDEALGVALRKAHGKNVIPADGGGYWVHNGTNASAITEGGIGSLIKATTDGQAIGFMSDRHDWLEDGMEKVSKILNKIPGVDISLEKSILDKSLAAISPPMYRSVYGTPKTPNNRIVAATNKYNAKSNPKVPEYQKDLKKWKKDEKSRKLKNKEIDAHNKGRAKNDPERKRRIKADPLPVNPVPSKPQTTSIKPSGNTLQPFDKTGKIRGMLEDVINIKPTNSAVMSEYLKRAGQVSALGSLDARRRLIFDEPRRTRETGVP